MRTLLKPLAYILISLIAILALVIVYLTQFFDANSYKPLIIEQAEKAGVPLQLNGDIEVTVFPWLGASIEGVKVLHPDNRDAQQPFAEVNQAGVKLKLMPLLSGNVEVDRIVLDGLYADLEVDKNGQGNWQAFIPAPADPQESTQDQSTPQTETPQDTDGSAPPAFALAVAGIDITNTRLNYTDHSQNLSAQIKQLDLHSDRITLGQAFPVTLSTEISSSNPDLNAKLQLSSQVYLNLAQQIYQLEQLQLDLNAQTPLVSPEPFNVQLQSNIKAQMQSGDIQVSGLGITLNGLSYPLAENDNAQIDMTLQADAALNLNQQIYQLSKLIANGSVKSQLTGDQPLNLQLSSSASADLQKQQAVLNNTQISLAEINIGVQATIKQLLDNPKATGQLQITSFSPKELLQRLNIQLPEMADNSVLNHFALTTNLSLNNNVASLQDIQLAADQSLLTGQTGINLNTQAMFATLNLDQIDLDRYLPPVSEAPETEKTDQPTPQPPSTEESDLIPVDTLKPLQAKAKITVGNLVVKKHPISNILLDLDANKGLIKLKAADAELYKGKIKNTAQLNLNKTPIQMQFSNRTDGIQLNPLLTTAAEFSQMAGAAHFKADMTTQTNRMSTILANLNGDANFNILNGAFLGVNISRELCDALSGKAQLETWPADTQFSSISGNMRFTQGVGNNENMTVAIPGIKMTGFGTVNLPKSLFDYNLGAQITDAHDKICIVDKNLKSVRWPVACKGHYGEPFDMSCGLDASSIGDSLANIAEAEAKAALKKEEAKLKAKLKEETEKAEQKLEDKAKKELEKAFKGLFN